MTIQPPPILPEHVHPEAGSRPIPWYRTHLWMTLMVSAVPLLNFTLFSLSGGRSDHWLVLRIVGLLAMLILGPFVLFILVSGPVYGGPDRTGRWPISTKLLAGGWTAFGLAVVVWMIFNAFVASGESHTF